MEWMLNCQMFQLCTLDSLVVTSMTSATLPMGDQLAPKVSVSAQLE